MMNSAKGFDPVLAGLYLNNSGMISGSGRDRMESEHTCTIDRDIWASRDGVTL